MPARLDEISNLTFVDPYQQFDGGVRYANTPPVQDAYKNFTIIEDVTTCNTMLPPGTQSQYPMAPYNSNNLIPSYKNATCPPPAQQYVNNLMNKNPGATSIEDIYQNATMYLPRQQSFSSNVINYNKTQPQYALLFANPPFAGSVPPMKNAVVADVSIPMIPPQPEQEGFEIEKDSNKVDVDNCLECSKHVSSCNLCNRLTQCPQTKWYIITGILVLIILLLLMYIYLSKKTFKTNIPRMY